MSPTRSNRNAALHVLSSGALTLAALLTPSVARAQSSYPNPYTITTLAGEANTDGGFADGTGPAAQFDLPTGIAVDSNGNAYTADSVNNTIRKISPSGVVTTLAGTAGTKGSTDATGAAARFNTPAGVAVDGSGNVYVADQGNDIIRMITPAGVVTTIAGTAGVTGSNDGTGPAAQFNDPTGVTVDGSGNVFVADQINDTIRKIAPGGVVTTIAGLAGGAGSANGTGSAGRFKNPFGIRADSSGNLWVTDTYNQLIREVTQAGVVTTVAGTIGHTGFADGTGTAATFYFPSGIGVDGSGNLYVADQGNSTIRKITSGGVVTTYLGGSRLYGFVDGTGTAAQFDEPYDVVSDSSGNLYISDEDNNTIRKATPSGVVTTLAGTAGGGYANGTGSAARFWFPTGVAVDSSGNIFVADEDNDNIRKVTPSGVVTTFAGTPGQVGTVDGTGLAAQFNAPFRITFDKVNSVFYVSDAGNNTIRKITEAGVVTTFAGTAGTTGSTNGTGSAASFSTPVGLCVDTNGNVYVAEQKNNIIRKITAAGVVTTLAGTAGSVGSSDGQGAAAQFSLPAGVAVDAAGNVFVADYGNDTIRKITPGGAVTTIAGQVGNPGSKDGTGTAAQFYLPVDLQVDANDNLYVVEQKNNDVRFVTSAGVVTTLAGTAPPFTAPGATPPIPGFANGTGASAEFNAPFGIALDASNNIYVADAGNGELRFGTVNAAPSIQTQPSTLFANVGTNVTLSVTATGSSTLSYQWEFNGVAISGATGSSYTITNAQTSNSGSYTVVVTDGNGSTTSSAATVTVSVPGSATARLVNISTRAVVGTGANILIPGLVISGSGSETLLIRADGPALNAFGVSGTLTQPVLSVFNSAGTMLATNTGWGNATNAAAIASAAVQAQTFALASGSADSALLMTLPAGAYTLQISGVGGTTGVALAEVYEVTYTGATRLSNISTRAQVGTGGNIEIAGFVIKGSGTDQLLVRADGPVLSTFSVAGVLAQPVLTLIDSSMNTVATNTGWANSSTVSAATTLAQTFQFPAGSADSAVVVNLPAGAYTAQIAGVGGTTGVALAEVYEVP